MPSHIGFESVITHDNFTLSRSLIAENSPYYETGVKFYGSNKLKNLFIAGLLLNGWQTIAMPYGIQSPSLGFQITLKESHNIELNYSNFWGYIFRDSLLRRRVYHNFYSRYSIKSFDLLAGFDYRIDLTNHQIPQNWWTFAFLVRKKILIRNAVALRLEYFNDHHKVIESNPLLVPFKSWGYSINFDHSIKNLLFRCEARLFVSDSTYFDQKKENFCITTSISIKI